MDEEEMNRRSTGHDNAQAGLAVAAIGAVATLVLANIVHMLT